MEQQRMTTRFGMLGLYGALAVASHAQAVEVSTLKDQGVDALFGQYAPGGDCARHPQIVVDEDGFGFHVAGKTERTTVFEFAVSYGGNYYEGISKWFFPFRNDAGYPILMTFNADEKPGVLTIAGHDEGWSGGPPLTTTNRALVEGSPYARCK